MTSLPETLNELLALNTHDLTRMLLDAHGVSFSGSTGKQFVIEYLLGLRGYTASQLANALADGNGQTTSGLRFSSVVIIEELAEDRPDCTLSWLKSRKGRAKMTFLYDEEATTLATLATAESSSAESQLAELLAAAKSSQHEREVEEAVFCGKVRDATHEIQVTPTATEAQAKEAGEVLCYLTVYGFGSWDVFLPAFRRCVRHFRELGQVCEELFVGERQSEADGDGGGDNGVAGPVAVILSHWRARESASWLHDPELERFKSEGGVTDTIFIGKTSELK